jgi:hypothetical protein
MANSVEPGAHSSIPSAGRATCPWEGKTYLHETIDFDFKKALFH